MAQRVAGSSRRGPAGNRGTGVNLPHYPEAVTRIVLSEPDAQMRKNLQRKTGQLQKGRLDIAPWEAESIEMPDASFDTIVSTLVLCSVPSLESSLKEIYRLLRPNGVLLFLEHVISDHPPTLTWQRRIEPFWSFCAGNCRLTRNTAAAIELQPLFVKQFVVQPENRPVPRQQITLFSTIILILTVSPPVLPVRQTMSQSLSTANHG